MDMLLGFFVCFLIGVTLGEAGFAVWSLGVAFRAYLRNR